VSRICSRRDILASSLCLPLLRAQTDPSRYLSLFDFESEARTKISHGAWERISGAAADEITLRWNHEAYEKIRLRPRILVDVSKVDTRVTLLGQQLSHPILLAPTGGQKFVHPEGELAAVRGAAGADATYVISSSASMRVEDIAKTATKPVWFQIYVQRDRGFTRDLVQRAEDSGCRALCLTVDTPTNGARNRENRAKSELPERQLPNLMGQDFLDPSLSWKDVDWLRSFIRRPLLLKGVLTPEDADAGVKAGVAGIIVSNHGARNLDTLPATIDALPGVVEKVAGRVPVIVDGGIRRGTDVVKALAFGATAVQIGRPYLWGLGVAGSAGVTRVVEILRKELEMAMALLGRPTLASIDRTVLW